MSETEPKSWRNVIKVHPAADLFPMMSPAELKALGEDIKANGFAHQIVLWTPDSDYWKWNEADCRQKFKRGEFYLLDGRNRVAALVSLGYLDGWPDIIWPPAFDVYAPIILGPDVDPYEYVLSANVHRRHLTAEQKRELIVAVLKAQPSKSNRTIARQTKADDKTVAAVRSKLEATAEIPQLIKTVGADGKARRTARTRKARNTADDIDAKARADAVADRADERSTQTHHIAEEAQTCSMPKQSDLEPVLPDADRLVLGILERDKIAPGYAKAVMAGIAAKLEVSGYPDLPRREPTISDART